MARYTQYRSRARKPTYKRYYRRRRQNNSSGLWNLAKKAANGVVKYYLNPEYKFLDSSYPISVLGTAGQIQSIPSLISQGDSSTSRDGNSIKITSILVRANITQTVGTTTPVTTRFMIFSDSSSNGTPPQVLDVLQTADVLSPMNRVNGSRFTVLSDKLYTTDPDDLRKGIKIYRKLQHHIHYLDGTNTVTSLGQGVIYFLWITDTGAGASSIAWNCRMRFLDN